MPRVRVGGSSGHRAATAMLSRRGVLAAAAAAGVRIYGLGPIKNF